LAAAAQWVVLAMLFGPAAAWESYGGGPGGGQYSPLAAIDTGNVHRLEQAWIYHTGDFSGDGGSDPTTFEANPIHAYGKLYFCTPYNRLVALEADTGREAWTFDPGVARDDSLHGAHVCRGVAYWEEAAPAPADTLCARRVFGATGDGRLVAVDAASGRACPDFGEGGEVRLDAFDYYGTDRVGMTSPPAVIGDLVITGASFASYGRADGPDGIVRAFDARSGRQVWAWNPVPAPLRRRAGGMNVWAPMSVDRERNLVFLPTTSPTPDPWGGARTAPLPYANAVVALDAGDGSPAWHYQVVHHDLWEFDLPAQPILSDLVIGNRTVPVVIQITKHGFVFVFERETGKPVFEIEERPVPASDVPGEMTAPTQPVPLRPPPFARQTLAADEAWGLTFWDRGRCREKIAALRNEGLFTPPSLHGTVHLPSTAGGGNWGAAAYDPARGLLIVNAIDIAFSSTLYERADFDPSHASDVYAAIGEMPDAPYGWIAEPLLSPFGIPCTPPPWGTLTAIDLRAGAILWQIPFGRMPLGPFHTPRAWGAPNVGGPILTAGGLVFIGASFDRRLRAYDAATGAELWSAKLPAAGIATPMTYEAGDPPRQYVVIAAGGHPLFDPRISDALVAFALPADGVTQ
jgi:quinoprotein glucose dehydrogenase